MEKQKLPINTIFISYKKVDLREDVETVKKLKEKSEVAVSLHQGLALSRDIGAVKYVECSALTQKWLKNVFEEAIRAALSLDVKPAKKRRCNLL